MPRDLQYYSLRRCGVQRHAWEELPSLLPTGLAGFSPAPLEWQRCCLACAVQRRATPRHVPHVRHQSDFKLGQISGWPPPATQVQIITDNHGPHTRKASAIPEIPSPDSELLVPLGVAAGTVRFNNDVTGTPESSPTSLSASAPAVDSKSCKVRD